MQLLEKITDLILPIIESNDCYLDDIEYEKESNDWYLRIFIEKNEGSLDMDTCVLVSEKISEMLDDVDPIKDEYYLEVSSPGAEKPLKTLDKVKENIGEYVYAQFINPIAGLNEIEGFVLDVDEENNIEFQYLVKNIKKKIIVNYDNIKFIRLAVKF